MNIRTERFLGYTEVDTQVFMVVAASVVWDFHLYFGQ